MTEPTAPGVFVARWNDGNSVAVTLHPSEDAAYAALAGSALASLANAGRTVPGDMTDRDAVAAWFASDAGEYESYTIEPAQLPDWLTTADQIPGWLSEQCTCGGKIRFGECRDCGLHAHACGNCGRTVRHGRCEECGDRCECDNIPAATEPPDSSPAANLHPVRLHAETLRHVALTSAPPQCPQCSEPVSSWPLGVHNLRVVIVCPHCHVAAANVEVSG